MGPGFEGVLTGLQANAEQLNRIMQHADTLVVGSQEDVHNSLKSLRQVVERLDMVLQRVDQMVLYKETELDSTLSNLYAASKAVREISEHPWKLITGQNKPVTEPAESDE
jgi:ABC-type transporter Mla subunit MlaD